MAETSTPPRMVSSTAEPPIAPRSPGYEKHDGFMLRLALGFGGAGAKASPKDSSGPDLGVSGAGGTFSLDLGGAPVENLVIHFRITDFLIFSPTLSLDGETVGDATNVSFGALMLAPAVTYYFMPINVYLTAAIGMSRIVVENDQYNVSGATKFGLGLNFDLGKEWWVSDNWGLGLAGRFWYTSASEDEATWSFFGGALLFSATYQ